jgi:hypothetical protein
MENQSGIAPPLGKQLEPQYLKEVAVACSLDSSSSPRNGSWTIGGCEFIMFPPSHQFLSSRLNLNRTLVFGGEVGRNRKERVLDSNFKGTGTYN